MFIAVTTQATDVYRRAPAAFVGVPFPGRQLSLNWARAHGIEAVLLSILALLFAEWRELRFASLRCK
jgi:hypothetical protein